MRYTGCFKEWYHVRYTRSFEEWYMRYTGCFKGWYHMRYTGCFKEWYYMRYTGCFKNDIIWDIQGVSKMISCEIYRVFQKRMPVNSMSNHQKKINIFQLFLNTLWKFLGISTRIDQVSSLKIIFLKHVIYIYIYIYILENMILTTRS